MNPDKKKNLGVVNDEVEELLKAAEDAALLKLRVNAHAVHGVSSDHHSNSYLRTKEPENIKPSKKKSTGMVDDEVEELLRAAEDAALLNLNVNAHSVHGSSSDLHPDLHQRFHALKSGSRTTTKTDVLIKSAQAPPETSKLEEDDDLFARFAALKDSLPKPSSSAISSSSADVNTLGNVNKIPGGSLDVAVNMDDEDEVEKVIQWAMDAARLDPSPSSDEDDDNFDDSEKSDEDDDRPEKDRKDDRK